MISFETLRDVPHREATGRLLADGWNVCGIGDWATVWRSPDGTQVARVSPFEPTYEVFVELCCRLAGHALLPRVDFDTPLAGGGRLTVLWLGCRARTSSRRSGRRRRASVDGEGRTGRYRRAHQMTGP